MSILMTLFFLLLWHQPASSSELPDAWGVPYFSTEKVFIITHPSIEYDTQMVAKAAMERELQNAKNIGAVSIILVDGLTENANYLDESRFDLKNVYLTATGGHNLRFKRSPVYRLAGGHFNYCACRTLRDILLRERHERPGGEIQIELVRDGLYFFPENTDTLGWPERYALDGNADGISENLTDSQLFPNLETVARSLEHEYFPEVWNAPKSHLEKTMCKEFSDRFTVVKKKDFEFQILKPSGEILRTFGTIGAQKVKIVLD